MIFSLLFQVCQSIYSKINTYIYLSIYFFKNIYTYLSIYLLKIYTYTYLVSIYLFMYPFYPTIYLSISSTIYLSINLSILLSIYLTKCNKYIVVCTNLGFQRNYANYSILYNTYIRLSHFKYVFKHFQNYVSYDTLKIMFMYSDLVS